MKLKIALLVFGMGTMSASFASDWDITLRDKAKEPPKRESGAKLLYTNPDTGDSSYVIDGAINLTKRDRGVNNLYSHNIALELHRNTQTDKEVDTKMLSYSYGNQWLSDKEKTTSYHKAPIKVSYKVDDIKKTESIGASVSYYPEIHINENKKSVFNIDKDIFIGGWEIGRPHPSRISWQPNIGLFFENVIKSDKVDKGSVARLNAGVSVYINLLKDRLITDPKDKNKEIGVETLVLTLSYQYWNDIEKDEDTFGADDTHSMRVYKISYPIDRSGDMKIYLSHLDGGNPIKGKPEQEYSEIGLEFKLNLDL